MTEVKPLMSTCFLCEREFHYGEHRYEGKPVIGYGIMVCDMCRSANHDGIGPVYEAKVLNHCERNNLSKPEPNESGRLVLW